MRENVCAPFFWDSVFIFYLHSPDGAADGGYALCRALLVITVVSMDLKLQLCVSLWVKCPYCLWIVVRHTVCIRSYGCVWCVYGCLLQTEGVWEAGPHQGGRTSVAAEAGGNDADQTDGRDLHGEDEWDRSRSAVGASRRRIH